MLYTIIDGITLVVSLGMMGLMLIKYKKVDTLVLLLGSCVALNCLGRFMMATARTLETAVWANRFIYAGCCYAPLLLFIVLFKICNLKFPGIAKLILGLYSTFILALVLNSDHGTLYYKSMELVREDNYSYLIKEYGPLHILYPAMMTTYALFLIGFVIYGIINRKKVPIRTVVGTGAAGLVLMIAYIMEQIIDVHIALLSIGYLVIMIVLLRFFEEISTYDITASIASFAENRAEYGYIVIGRNNRLISYNSFMAEHFPEIKKWVIDSEITPEDSPLYKKAIRHFLDTGWKICEEETIQINDRYYKTDIHPMMHRKKQTGYIIEFADKTIEQKYYNGIENYNTQLEREVAVKTADILHIKDMMVLGMADMVESRDNNTGGHIKRTSAIVKIFSEKLRTKTVDTGLSEKFLKQVEKAAPMHDLGKIAIDDDILRKPGKFTDDEFAQMKRHTTEGERIVTSILKGVEDDEFVEIARNVALYHHEKWNGKGYPMGIAGEEIPVEARIMALADVFDALVSKRCYKDAFSYDKAFSIIEEDLGTHFDPELGRIFLECREELIKSL
ncbi:MAG: HD domain-containing protein [Ruminiclostridium sp.]|nr:HD domain-containing protein [Ruminiclostridium sp.]